MMTPSTLAKTRPQSTAATATWRTTRNRMINVDGTLFAYRDLGPRTGVPLVFLHHFTAVLDDWDPRVIDGIAAKRHVITFDNRGVGASGGSVPHTIDEMAADAVAFIRALGYDQVDLLGFSLGGRAVPRTGRHRFAAAGLQRGRCCHRVATSRRLRPR